MATRTSNRNIHEDHGASDASLWASAYLSNFFEEVENPSPRPQRQCRSFHHHPSLNLGSSHCRRGTDPFRYSYGPTSSPRQQKHASAMRIPSNEAADADSAPPRRPGRRRRSTIDSPASIHDYKDDGSSPKEARSCSRTASPMDHSTDSFSALLMLLQEDYDDLPSSPRSDKKKHSQRRKSKSFDFISVADYHLHQESHKYKKKTSNERLGASTRSSQLVGDAVSMHRDQDKRHRSHRLAKSFHCAPASEMADPKSERTYPKKSNHRQSISCHDLQDFAEKMADAQSKPKDHLRKSKIKRSGNPRRRSTIDDPSFDEHARRVHFSNTLHEEKKNEGEATISTKPNPRKYSSGDTSSTGQRHRNSYPKAKSCSPQSQLKSPTSFDKQADFPDLPFCPKSFKLGDIASPQDMIIEPDASKALQSIKTLKSHDFAWIRRSNGTWAYSIVANFPESGRRATIRFVVDRKGSTKTVSIDKWAKCIRLVKEVVHGSDLTRNDNGNSKSTQHATVGKEELIEQLRKEQWMNHPRNEIKRKKDKYSHTHS